jgi:hypothetical protein
MKELAIPAAAFQDEDAWEMMMREQCEKAN